MPQLRSSALRTTIVLVGIPLAHCSNSSPSTSGDGGMCFPDNDGLTGGTYTIEVAVDDTGFYPSGGDDAGMKNVITTQNNAMVKLTLKNIGTMPHGFEAECTSVTQGYPNLPAHCPTMSCFPQGSTIPPIDPGTSMPVMFITPSPDALLYPFKSTAPADANVPGLNGSMGSAWSLM